MTGYWAQRLEAIRAGKAPSCQLTKPPKPPFVSFGSKQDGRFHPESVASVPDHADLRATLRRLAIEEGLPAALVDRVTDADLHPDHGAHLLSDTGLRRWLHVLDENARMRQGMDPPGWTQASYCHRCGPVLLWQGAPPVVLGCPWCHVRRAGGHLPRPAITCATCTHQQLQRDTSEAGMHGCGKGTGMRFALELHPCEGWQPVRSLLAYSQEAQS